MNQIRLLNCLLLIVLYPLGQALGQDAEKEAPLTAPVEEAAPKTDANAGDKDPVGEAAEERKIRIQFEECRIRMHSSGFPRWPTSP